MVCKFLMSSAREDGSVIPADSQAAMKLASAFLARRVLDAGEAGDDFSDLEGDLDGFFAMISRFRYLLWSQAGIDLATQEVPVS